MALKFVEATSLRPGSFAIIQDAPCIIKNIDISKTGKHGASKARIEAIGIIDEKKRIVVLPGSEKIAVPMVNKRRGQVLSKTNNTISVMDLETYETLEMPTQVEVNEGDEVEYWDVEGEKIIKRKF